jgi:hypothetical protein
MTDNNDNDVYTNALIDAAHKHAEAYDDDDRECIKTDVMNAFYQGAAWHASKVWELANTVLNKEPAS